MYKYITVSKKFRVEKTIERSKFITSVTPCSSKEEAEAFFESIRNEFKDATHNVPAFILGDKMEVKWASDNGEPQGTAGPPILKYLESNNLTNIACMVTRYFGGIKLGTGGLARAYSGCVQEAVEQAGLSYAMDYIDYRCIMGYDIYNKIIRQGIPGKLGDVIVIGPPHFDEKVTVDISSPITLDEDMCAYLREVSQGEIEAENKGISTRLVALTTIGRYDNFK